MKSFRFRLVLGVALVAIVPLAIGMVLLSRRIEHTVRTQAANRLETSLAALTARLATTARKDGAAIGMVASEPTLRRLVLLRPASDRDLADYLLDRRALLGLDFLSVTDTGSTVIADAGDPGAEPREAAWLDALGRRGDDTFASPSVSFDAPIGLLDTLAGASAIAVSVSAPIVYEGRRVGSLVGARAIDAAMLAELRGETGLDLAVLDAAGHVVVATMPGAGGAIAPDGVQRVNIGGHAYLSRARPLDFGAGATARLVGLVPTGATDATIAAFRWASLLLAAMGLAVAALIGWVWSWRVARPVERLADYSARLARGEWETPLALTGVRELESLAAALDRMRTDLSAYRDRLKISERHAAWGQMARAVAHEVKNPLTPIAISVADLKRSYELGRADFPQILDRCVRTITEEIESLKRLLQEFSDFARLPAPRFEPCHADALFDGLAVLYGSEIHAGRLAVTHAGDGLVIEADPSQLRQALVNLIKNGLEALPPGGRVTVAAADGGDALEIVVADTGPGFTAEQRANLFVPGFTTKPDGHGLGLTLVERIVNDHRGTIVADSDTGHGATFRIRLPLTQPPAAEGN